MLETINTTIGGKPATIGKLPAAQAFDVGCVALQWRGRILAQGGDGATAMSMIGKGLEAQAQMLRDPTYRQAVWVPVLSVCTLNNLPVFQPDGMTLRPEHDLADLFHLHTAAIEHSCGSFLAALGAGGDKEAPPSA